jgi:transposase
VGEYLCRAEAAGLSWPLPEDLDESALERRLFPPAPTLPLAARPVPVWEAVHQELKANKGMSLFLLRYRSIWQEYKVGAPEGFQYSWFCEQYRAWLGKLDLVMRQEHRAGEKCFVDYAGQTVPVIDRLTGEARPAHVFVAVLRYRSMGASNYTYAEATWTEALPDWIGAHVRAFAYFGGVTELLVPDNLRSGVHKACRYEPDLNPTYQDLCAHYGVAVIPARVRRPRDKAKVEVGVQVVERWILARLRHAQFFSLPELNATLRRLLGDLNDRPFKKLPGSRRMLFESLDRPALRTLPAEPYEYAEWKRSRVHIDYHVEVDGHYYSVPYALVKQRLDVRVTAHIVEGFHKGQRVASHPRSSQKGRHTTLPEHMPQAHRSHAQWTPQRLIDWAAKTGPATGAAVEAILRGRAHPHASIPQQGFRSALGLMRLGKDSGAERLEAACRRALALGAVSFKSVQAILKHGLDRQPLPNTEPTPPVAPHENLRGPKYYH